MNGEGGTSKIDGVLADFRAWLAGALGAENGAPLPSSPAPAVDLHTLLGHFIALRQEVNLQTRATRSQQEQNDRALTQLEQALDALAQAQARAPRAPSSEEGLRPLLTTLIELHDAIALAGREMHRVQDSVLPLLEELVAPFADEEEVEAPPSALPSPSPAAPPTSSSAPRRSWWGRWFGSAAVDGADAELQAATARLHQAAAALEAATERLEDDRAERASAMKRARAGQAQDYCERVNQALASLVTGYTMSLQRIERALRQNGLDAIPTVGHVYDPELMEALGVVTDSGQPSGEVLQEVRRGYLWNGRVFRYAQVRVAKS